jgi:hypothetical protein
LLELLALFGGSTGLVGLIARQYLRYRKTVDKEIQPFLSYAVGGVRLRVQRRFNAVLSARFTLREWGTTRLRTFPRYLPVPTDRDDLRLDIDQIYIGLTLSGAGSQEVADSQLVESFAQSLLIYGDPGSGKSSLLKRAFRDACASAIRRPQTARTPLWVELKDVAWKHKVDVLGENHRNTPHLLYAATAQLRNNTLLYRPDVLIDISLARKGFTFLFDGLDEVGSTSLESAVTDIEELLQWLKLNSPASKCIVTARTQLSRQLPRSFSSAFDEISTIKPFSSTKIYEFLRRWPFPAKFREAEIERVWSYLRDQPTLGEICTNPLILSMYVANDQRYRGGDSPQDYFLARTPETRTAFYSLALGELLVYRRQQQHHLGAGRQSLRAFYEGILGRIALDLFCCAGSCARKDFGVGGGVGMHSRAS